MRPSPPRPAPPDLVPAASTHARRTASAIAVGACVVLLVPGLSDVGAPPHVPDESWRRPLALGLLAIAAALAPVARLPRRALVLALLAAAPAVAALLRPTPSSFSASSAPVFAALAGAILLGACVREPGSARRVVLGLGVAGSLAALHVLLDAATGRAPVGPFGRGGVAGPALAALLVPAALCGPRGAAWPRALRAIPALGVAAALLLTGSRTGALAGVAGAAAAALVLAPPSRRRATRILVASGAAVGIALVALLATGVVSGGATLRVRLGLLRASAALVAEAPLLGHGPNGFAREVLRIRDPEEAVLSAGARPFAAHADLAHVAAENGVPAALAIAALLVLALVVAARAATRAAGPTRRLAAALLAVVVATIVATFGEDPLLAVATSLPFGLATGLALAVDGAAPASGPVATSARRRVGLVVARSLVVVALAWLALTTTIVPLAGDRVLATHLAALRSADPAARARAHDRLRARAADAGADAHPALLYRLAVGYAEEGRAPDAWRVLDRLLRVDPGATEARLDLAELHRLAGRRDDARDVLVRARRSDPTRFDVVLRLGHLALGEEPLPGAMAPPDDPTAVLRLYDEALLLGPTRFEGAVALARLHRRMGDLADARRELARAKALGGLPGEVLLESFRLAEAEGSPSDAVAGILALAIAAQPSLAALVDAEATRLLDAGEEAARLALAAAAGALAPPELARAERLFAAATLRRGALVAAQAAPTARWRAEAASAAAAGRHRRAVATWRALLADPFAPEDPSVAFAASASARRFDGALADALSARARTLQAFQELAAHDLAGAERDFRAAAAKAPRLAAAHLGLASVLVRTGRLDEAVDAVARATDVDPSLLARARLEPSLAPIRDRLPAPR